jgi:hypothetical protein
MARRASNGTTQRPMKVTASMLGDKMRLFLVILILFCAIKVFGAEPPPPQPASTDVLIERRMRIEAQLQSLSYALKEINDELERRSKTPSASQKVPEKKTPEKK